MNFKHTLIASALLLSLAGAAPSAEWTLPTPGAADTVPTHLSSEAVKSAMPLETEPVQFAWRLDPAAPLQAIATPHLAQSREYWDKRSADEMAAGVEIPTASAGAIVRLSPAGGAAKALEARQVILRKDGRSYGNGEGMQSIATSEEMEKGSAPFPAGSTAFRIDPSLGSGAFELQVPAASGEVVVHVFEPESTLQLQLKTDRVSYQAGSTIRVDAALVDGARSLALDHIDGLVTSPSGEVREVRFVADKSGGYTAELPADFAAAAAPGMYEVQAFASAKAAGGTRVLRDARTSFLYTTAGARLTGAVRNMPVRMRDPFVYLQFDVEVAAPSRYQLGGVLYGTEASGALVPVAMAQSAAKLDVGVHGMTLLWGQDVLDGVAVGAPWEVRDLQLVNQANMGLLEQRVAGLKIGAGR